MGIFGFSTEASAGGDFLPVLKYDARAGRFFRVDRVNTGAGFVSEPADVTNGFKAMFDLENIETGWINFNTGGAPDFRLVPMGHALPQKPGEGHKNGIRFMVKLSKEIGGEKPIREISTTARAFLSGLEALYLDYEKNKSEHPGHLPIAVLETTVPIKSGQGQQQSTNYQPRFKIAGWAPRGDLVFQSRSPTNGATAAPAAAPQAVSPPNTGSTRVDPPRAALAAVEPADADDFG